MNVRTYERKNGKTNERKNKRSWVLRFFGSSVQEGFTLIEIVIYTALTALILGTAVLATNAALQIRTQTRNALILEQSMRFAMHEITEAIRGATNITVPVSVGVAEGALTLDVDITSEDPTTFTLSEGAITRTRGVLAPVALTPVNIEITALTFTRLVGSPAPVVISMQGQTSGGGVTQYTDTLTLRATALPHE